MKIDAVSGPALISGVVPFFCSFCEIPVKFWSSKRTSGAQGEVLPYWTALFTVLTLIMGWEMPTFVCKGEYWAYLHNADHVA